MQQRLVEAGLELECADQDAVLVASELFRRLCLGEVVHACFGVAHPAILNLAGKRHQRFKHQAALCQPSIESQFEAHGMQARARHDHGLGPPADATHHTPGEVVQDDVQLGLDGVIVQLDERAQHGAGLLALIVRIVLHLLEQVPVAAVGSIVLQHVQDEMLLNSLAHAV